MTTERGADPAAAVRFGGRPGATHRLVCLPYAGGGASVYRDWPRLFPPWLEVVALRLPGREVRIAETPLESVAAMVDELADVLAAIGAEAPGSYSLFGHSLGAVLGFELAHELRRRGGAAPARLFVSGRCAPQLPQGVPHISGLSDREFVEAIRGLGGTPAAFFEAEDLLEVVLPSLRADFVAAESYRCTVDEPLDVPISVFGGADDPTVGRWQLQAWGERTSGDLTVRVLPGDHFFFVGQSVTVATAICHDLEAG